MVRARSGARCASPLGETVTQRRKVHNQVQFPSLIRLPLRPGSSRSATLRSHIGRPARHQRFARRNCDATHTAVQRSGSVLDMPGEIRRTEGPHLKKSHATGRAT